MKPYSRFIRVLVITLFIFSCQKELEEGGDNPMPKSVYNWSFKDSRSTSIDIKAGYTDAANIRKEEDIQTFLYEGSSGDHNKGIVFQVTGQPLGVGVYSGEQVAFSYSLGSTLVYTNVGVNSDFNLTITYLTRDSISATFSGHVRNSDGSLILLNDGFLQTRIGTPVEDTTSGGDLICSSILVNGKMASKIAVDFNNYVDMQVHITRAGNYTFETPVINGVLFSGEQNFTDTGSFSVRLNAKGTPKEAGSFEYPLQFGNTTCSFNILIDVETIIDGTRGTLARQIREENSPATVEFKYYQLHGLIGELQSPKYREPLRKVYYNENNQISKVEIFRDVSAYGFMLIETQQYIYNPEGYVSGIINVDHNGNFIDSVASYSYLPNSNLLASRTFFSLGRGIICQLYYTYANGNLVKIERTTDYSSSEVIDFEFDKSHGNGFKTLHTQMYFLDMATFFEDGNYPEVLYFSKNLPISKTVGTKTTPINIVVNTDLRPISITYNGVLWYKYEYN